MFRPMRFRCRRPSLAQLETTLSLGPFDILPPAGSTDALYVGMTKSRCSILLSGCLNQRIPLQQFLPGGALDVDVALRQGAQDLRQRWSHKQGKNPLFDPYDSQEAIHRIADPALENSQSFSCLFVPSGHAVYVATSDGDKLRY
jgi:hypothetical protein